MKKITHKFKIWIATTLAIIIISAISIYYGAYIPHVDQINATEAFLDNLVEFQLPNAYDSTSELMKLNADKITFIQYLQNFDIFKGKGIIDSYLIDSKLKSREQGIPITTFNTTLIDVEGGKWNMEITLNKENKEWKVSGVFISLPNQEV
ncbi:hypothetical protein HOD30_01440 [Candidatus Peregrinibacteria bacterium]|jgi:hypothetical protein|nr:hypothetical protein [Candidatus Peregrinibacteria bacterium]MBT4632233.1 hypothetical protein [Candidatus Peregrinibacteria bacterium]MBT5516676.1 hypothetical protein [Candidatus Peregrinibacteria bacterium]MBT5824356.1 hypothetical protein [Candidatus Peregrinibacteria bacterium]